MDELRDLSQIFNTAAERFSQYKGKDFVLPQVFKDQVKEINSNTITYNKFSAIIETKGTQNGVLNIFLPNQWFYIASYFTDFYNELLRYKKEALKVTSKERLKILNGSVLNNMELNRLNALSLNNTSKIYLQKFITDYSWWNGAKTIDRGDFYVSPILSSAKLVNASQSFVADLCAFLADKKELVKAIIEGEESSTNDVNDNGLYASPNQPLQQIIYGAPGTGKSHEIKESTATADKEGRVIRTTFHPDSDYSTFVGAYKPTSVEVPVMTMIGTKAVPAENPDGTQRKEKKIVYEFVPQAFLKSYTGAWKNQDKPFFLIIEEINRGNCAQIFGDLFQLLDRNDEGMSEYPISPDEDIQKFLLTDKKYGFANLTEEQKTVIPNEVRNGELLILPKNLHIWATMNTSDQSLFPIDSAFKRRWDWKYIPIVNGEKGWMIEVNGKRYNWWTFLDTINEKIYHFTHSEDKKMGYFFCKPKGSIIDIETFVGKVIFYIWNDVFKDIVEEAGDLFKDADSSLLSFNKFYSVGNDGKAKVVANKVELFLQNVGVEPEKVDNNPVLDEDGNDVTGTGNRNYDYTKYSINGQGSYPKGRVAQEAISLFISLHPEMSDIDVVNTWVGLNVKIPNIVETSQMFASRTSSSSDPGLSNRFKTIQMPNGNILYVSNQYNVERINDLIEKVNAQPWGIHIESI